MSCSLTLTIALGVAKTTEAIKARNISAERLKSLFTVLKPAEDLDLLAVTNTLDDEKDLAVQVKDILLGLV